MRVPALLILTATTCVLTSGCGPSTGQSEEPVIEATQTGSSAAAEDAGGVGADPASASSADDPWADALTGAASSGAEEATGDGSRPEPNGASPADWVDLEEFRDVLVRVEREEKDGRLVGLRHVKVSDGSDHGPDWRFHPNGVLMSTRTWVDGKVEGQTIGWFDTGFVRLEGSCIGGERHGLWRRHFDDVDDGVAWERGYDNGKPHGVWKRWWRGGAPKDELTYEQGEQTGKEIGWALNGTVILDAEWLAGQRHGPYREAEEETGMPKVEGFYELGEKIGFWVEHTNGVKRSEGEYIDGVREGIWTFWNEDGSVDEARSGEYVTGVLREGGR